MPLADLKTLTAALSEAVRAQDSKNSKKALRLQRLQATIAGQDDDPEIEASIRLVRAELQRLGFGEINAYGQAGIEPLEIHKRGKAANWGPDADHAAENRSFADRSGRVSLYGKAEV